MSIFGNKLALNKSNIQDKLGLVNRYPTDKLSLNSLPNEWIVPTYDFDVATEGFDFNTSTVALDFDNDNPREN